METAPEGLMTAAARGARVGIGAVIPSSSTGRDDRTKMTL